MAFNLFKRRKNVPLDENTQDSSSLSIDSSVPTELSFGQLQALGWQRTANTGGKVDPVVNFSKGGSVISVDPSGSATYSLGSNHVGSGPSMEHLTITDPQTIFSSTDMAFAKSFEASQLSPNSASLSSQQPQSTTSHAPGSAAPTVIQPRMLGENVMEVLPAANTVSATPSSTDLKINTTIADPTDIVSHSQKQTFENLAASSSSSSPLPQDQSAIAHKLDQMDKTAPVVGGNTTGNGIETSAFTDVSLKSAPTPTTDLHSTLHDSTSTSNQTNGADLHAAVPSYAAPRQAQLADATFSEVNTTGGGTSNLTSSSPDALLAKNHAVAVEQENILASKLATDKVNADLKQVNMDNSVGIVSNDQKNALLKSTASVSPAGGTETNTGRVGENGGSGQLASTSSNHFTEHGGPGAVASAPVSNSTGTNAYVMKSDEATAINKEATLKLDTAAAASPAGAINEQGLVGSVFTLPVSDSTTGPTPPIAGITAPDIGKPAPHTSARWGDNF